MRPCKFNKLTNSFDCEEVIDERPQERPQFSCDKEWPDPPKLEWRPLND